MKRYTLEHLGVTGWCPNLFFGHALGQFCINVAGNPRFLLNFWLSWTRDPPEWSMTDLIRVWEFVFGGDEEAHDVANQEEENFDVN